MVFSVSQSFCLAAQSCGHKMYTHRINHSKRILPQLGIHLSVRALWFTLTEVSHSVMINRTPTGMCCFMAVKFNFLDFPMLYCCGKVSSQHLIISLRLASLQCLTRDDDLFTKIHQKLHICGVVVICKARCLDFFSFINVATLLLMFLDFRNHTYMHTSYDNGTCRWETTPMGS